MERLKIVGEIILEEKGLFTINKISQKTGLSPLDVRVVLDRLFRKGLLLRFKIDPRFSTLRGRPGAKYLYQKENKKRFLKKITPKLKENTAQDRMWTAIRYKSHADRTFSIAEIIRLANVGRENARWFVKMLRRAGIVRQQSRGQWVLIKDTGPKRPYVTAKKKTQSAPL